MIEVYSEWCGSCQSVLPTFKRIRQEKEDPTCLEFLMVRPRATPLSWTRAGQLWSLSKLKAMVIRPGSLCMGRHLHRALCSFVSDNVGRTLPAARHQPDERMQQSEPRTPSRAGGPRSLLDLGGCKGTALWHRTCWTSSIGIGHALAPLWRLARRILASGEVVCCTEWRGR